MNVFEARTLAKRLNTDQLAISKIDKEIELRTESLKLEIIAIRAQIALIEQEYDKASLESEKETIKNILSDFLKNNESFRDENVRISVSYQAVIDPDNLPKEYLIPDYKRIQEKAKKLGELFEAQGVIIEKSFTISPIGKVLE